MMQDMRKAERRPVRYVEKRLLPIDLILFSKILRFK